MTAALTCDVCGTPAIGVACSALGACSFAYCRECAVAHAEPYRIAVMMVATIGDSPEALAAWFLPVVAGTCSRAGKTEAEFWDDVKAEIAGGMP